MKNTILSILAIGISLLAIGFSILRITPFEITNDVYIGIIATFIGISVTLLIGYQIYNTIEIRREIKEVQLLSKDLKEKNDSLDIKLELQDSSIQGGLFSIIALQKYSENRSENGFIAFKAIHNAMFHYLLQDTESYDSIYRLMREYIANIDRYNFCHGGGIITGDGTYLSSDNLTGEQKNIKDIVSERFNDVASIEVKIRENKNFNQISTEYNRIMKIFWTRMDEISNDPMKNLSQKEKFAIMHPEEYLAECLKRDLENDSE